MSTISQFVASTLADRNIDEEEVKLIRQRVLRDRKLDLDDVKLLVELYCEARNRCPEFDDLFFAVLEKVMLADGVIDASEQYYLLKMIYSDRVILPRERDFLVKVRKKATQSSPEFDALCEEALRARATDWDVGGR